MLSTEKLYVQETPGITDVHVTEENGAPHLQVRANVLCVRERLHVSRFWALQAVGSARRGLRHERGRPPVAMPLA